MADITSHRLLWFKFSLFVLLGALAASAQLLLFPDWRVACLMPIGIWAWCRAYYFAFYVIEHYVDPKFRFGGLGAFARYALGELTRRREHRDP